MKIMTILEISFFVTIKKVTVGPDVYLHGLNAFLEENRMNNIVPCDLKLESEMTQVFRIGPLYQITIHYYNHVRYDINTLVSLKWLVPRVTQ